VNEARLAQLEPTQTIVNLCQWEDTEAELDEMWSFVGSKRQQRWLWHAIDHTTGAVLAYVLAEHKDAAFLELKALLEPFGITQFYTDGWGAYERHVEPVFHTVGKVNTQTIERKHLTLRTRIKRLARKTICFSRSEWLHDVVIGLFIMHASREPKATSCVWTIHLSANNTSRTLPSTSRRCGDPSFSTVLCNLEDIGLPQSQHTRGQCGSSKIH
jgi:IS1 family transposase